MTAGFDKFLLQFRIRPPVHGGPGGDKQIDPRGKLLLVLAEHLAEAAFGPVAQNGPSDGRRRGGRANAGFGRSCLRAPQAPNGEGAAVPAHALFADGADVALAAQVLLRAESHGRRRNQATVNRLRPLRRRAASALRPPRVAMRARNPMRRTRFLRCGRKVGFMGCERLRVDGSASSGRGCQGGGLTLGPGRAQSCGVCDPCLPERRPWPPCFRCRPERPRPTRKLRG